MTDHAGRPTEPVVPPGRPCAICLNSEAKWLHSLDEDRLQFRVYGKGHTLASRMETCERCERLYQAGEDEALVAVQHRTWEQTEQDVDEHIRKQLAVMRAADLGATALGDWLPPGVTDLAAQGFRPIEELTGDMEVAQLWPEEHRRAVRETRREWLEDAPDGLCWLVRSPWPAIPLFEVIRLMWSHAVEALPDYYGKRAVRITPEMEQQHNDVLAQFLRLDEETIFDFRRTHPAPRETDERT